MALSKRDRAALALAYGNAQGGGVSPEAVWLAQSQAATGSIEDYDAQEREEARLLAIKRANAPGMGESIARGAAQGITFGFADEIGAGLQSVGSKRSYREIRDEIRERDRAAAEESPIAYGVADVLGSLAPALVTGGATATAAAGRGASTVVRAGIAGAAEGAAAGTGYSEADTIEGVLADAAKGAAIGGVVGAGVGKLTDNAIAGAESKATQQFAQDITAGADPTFRKRFLGQSDKLAKGDVTAEAAQAQKLLQGDEEMARLLKKPHASDAAAASDIVDHAKSKLDELSEKVAPIYKKLDQEVGEVPLVDVTDWMDEAIDKARRTHGQEALADTLKEVRGEFVKVRLAQLDDGGKALAKALDDPATADAALREISQIRVPHQEIRRWVTGLKEHKIRTMGSLNETEHFKLVNEAHRVADNFLRSHLDSLAQPNTGLAPIIDGLRDLNRQIAIYAGTKQLFQHKVAKGLMRQTAWQEAASSRMNQIAGVVGAMTSGSPIGALQAIGVSEGIKRGIQGIRKLDRVATAALARVVRAAREGDETARLVQKAIEAGVPATAVSAALATYRAMREE